MPESMEGANQKSAPEIESHPEAAQRATRWTRGHTIWALIIASLIPGLVIAVYRNHWEDLPTAVQLGTYAVCAILVMIVVGLIIAPRDEDEDEDDN